MTTDLGQRSGKDDDLVDLAHLGQEIVHSRTLDDIDIVGLRFDLYGHDVVGRGKHLEARVE